MKYYPMVVQFTKLGESKKLGIILTNIRYIEDYNKQHSKMHLMDSNQILYIQESLEEVCEIINKMAKKYTVNLNVYHSKSLFGK